MGSILYETLDAVAIVTMAKPPHNLIDDGMLDALAGAFARAVEDRRRAILLRSSMRHFCAGADLALFQGGGWSGDQARLDRLWAALEDVPLPTVAAVHGAALGGGFELALLCDFIVAADTASIGMAEVTLGLLPLLGGVQRVAQRAGVARAKEMAMLGRRHEPRALERWGIVNLVAPEAELADVSLSWARQLAAGPTVALRGMKTLANLAARGGIGAADARQSAANDLVFASDDLKRGLDAFVTSGPGSAVFGGR